MPENDGSRMGFFSKVGELFAGRRRAGLARARRLEATGALEEATASYVELDERAEAVRVLLLRAEAALDVERRRLLLGQAAALASGEQAREVEAKRARLTLDLIESSAYAPSRAELQALAARLEQVGEAGLAAEVYARVGDREAEARMLVEAGAIDRLEAVLDSEQARERAERERLALHTRVGDLALSGARREALAVGGDLREPDARVADLLKSIQVRRISLPRVRLSLGGETLDVIFGDEVTLGRAEATLVIASPAVSRTHLSIRRSPEGPEAVDLGSRNGTLLAGARLGAPVRVGPGLELELGGEVRVQLTPWQNGGVRIAYASEVVHAPLGALELDGWKLSAADDGWLELELGAPALLDALAVHGVIQLLRGDRLRRSVDGPVLLEVVE